VIEPRVTKRYVQGLLQVASDAACVDQLEQELKSLDDVLRQNQPLLAVLYRPTVSRSRKKALLNSVLGNTLSPMLRRFLDYLVDKKRESILSHLYEQYKNEADELRGMARAQVRSATPLSPQQQERLVQQLGRMLGKRVECTCDVDSALLGGIQVVIGTYIIDGSVTGRLSRLHKHLLEQSSPVQTVA
jgi:F-type H+-transporting ATPase subunit delta